MGFAASQARLLVLTARKSDLEFRAQQITNAEMRLAMRSEEVANKYSRALSNQTLKLINGGEQVNINADNLESYGFTVMYYSDEDKLWHKKDASDLGGLSGEYGDIETKLFIPTKVDNDPSLDETKKAIIKKYCGTFTAATDVSSLTTNLTNLSSQIGISVSDILEKYFAKGPNQKRNSSQDFGNVIIEGIDRGTYKIVRSSDLGNQTTLSNDQIKDYEVSVHNGTGFSVCYDTSDDEKADAEYRSETAAIQVKEKRLQMEMTQVEAQQKACDNEIESIKKWRDKNIETMFKYAG